MVRTGFLTVAATFCLLLLPVHAASTAEDTASVADLAWMAGHWRGEGLGGECEEIWSAPMAGTMVGTFRLTKDGEVQFYELLLLTREADGIVMKVKHFTPDFVGWEEKEGAVDFLLENAEPNHARFKGLTVDRDGDELEIKLRMRSNDGSVREEPFRFRRYDP